MTTTQDEPAKGAPYDIENELPATLHQAFATGHLSPTAALRGLALRYQEIDALYNELGQDRDRVRGMMTDVIATLPQQQATVAGLTIAITGGGESTSWDTRALDALLAGLIATGDIELMRIANQIAQARKTNQRSASLRITRAKP